MVGAACGGAQQRPLPSSAICRDTAHSHRKLYDTGSLRLHCASCSDVPHREQRVERHRLQFPRGWWRQRVRGTWLGHWRGLRVRLQQEGYRYKFYWDIYVRTTDTEAVTSGTTADRSGDETRKYFARIQTAGTQTGVIHREPWSRVF